MSILSRGALLAAFATVMALLAGRTHAAEYTLVVEPTFPAAQLREVYGPLLAYLDRSTGQRFSVRAAPSFNQHWRDLRAGTRADFVFEEGHFFDYRRQRSGFVALARTQEDSAYAIAVADPEIAAEGRDGIVGRTVASLGAPNLGDVLVFDDFRNPLAQPEMRPISSKWSDGPDLVFAGDVEGTLLPAYLAAENPALTEIWRSRDVPGRVLSASPELPQDVRQKVAEAMLRLHEDPEAFAVMNELRTERFVPVDVATYAGLERLLANSFGYTPPARAAAATAAGAASAPGPAPTARSD